MLSSNECQQIIALVKRQVVPAMGCTEPICVALATSRATEELGCRPERIEAYLSANILKNAMGVGIPGTGMVGLPIAIALGALIGRSEYGLEVLKNCTPEAVEEGKAFIKEERIGIHLNEATQEKLYVEVVCHSADGHSAKVRIEREHTRFTYVEKDGEERFRSDLGAGEETKS